MPYQEMRSEMLPARTDPRWFHSETVTDATSVPLLLPALKGGDVAVMVSPGTSARVEHTLDTYEAIDAGTAIWSPWGYGDASEIASDSVPASVTALRLVSVGTSDWRVTLAGGK
jgi:hypothetical protein